MLALTTRKPTVGPELELVESALRTQYLSPSLLFREPKLPTGFPDVVSVTLSKADVLFSPERMALRPLDLKIVHHLFHVRGSAREDLPYQLSLSPAESTASLSRLVAAGLVRHRGRRVFCNRLATVFAAREIIAIEAKIKDWQSGIRQAAANTWFASHSYVLLPEAVVSAAARSAAERVGVGIMAFDGRQTRILLRAKRHKIPSSYGSWLVNEWTVRSGALGTQE
jgi:hypothetical protein